MGIPALKAKRPKVHAKMVKRKPIVAIPFPEWCLLHGLPKPVAEHRFHPQRRWRFDWAWVDQKVAVEVHGGVFRGGHHTRGKGFLDDREKMASAQVHGWVVFEVAPSGKHPNTLYSATLHDWVRIALGRHT